MLVMLFYARHARKPTAKFRATLRPHSCI